ncbi:MAG: helix-turn-helix transcriptional regulator [Lachnospiraceae bacterium]
MTEYLWETAEEINQALAGRVRAIRKRRSISQEKLSEMSGVSLGSVKRFERTGNISLLSLTKIANALGLTDEIKSLFTAVPYRSIEEVIHETK